ncbi:MAG: hypothetical protein PHX40_03095 [Bacilli bacterium]|nr:hypothetical protein [Bacilli bacterium]
MKAKETINNINFETKEFDNGKIWYKAHFSSLMALHNYLKSNPKINTRIFETRQSISDDESFHGEPLDTAITYLKGGYKKNFKDFIALKRELDSRIVFNSTYSDFEKTTVGSRICIPNVLAGSPKFMIKPAKEKQLKFVDVYYNLGYPQFASDEVIRNRGLIALNLIKILENNDYRVNLTTFKLLKVYDKEYMYISIILKNQNDLLNVSQCYFPFVGVEFNRRIMFNLIETMNVRESYWQNSYGTHIKNDETRERLELPKNAILIGFPSQMGITDDLNESFNNVMENIDIDKYVKIKKL